MTKDALLEPTLTQDTNTLFREALAGDKKAEAYILDQYPRLKKVLRSLDRSLSLSENTKLKKVGKRFLVITTDVYRESRQASEVVMAFAVGRPKEQVEHTGAINLGLIEIIHAGDKEKKRNSKSSR